MRKVIYILVALTFVSCARQSKEDKLLNKQLELKLMKVEAEIKVTDYQIRMQAILDGGVVVTRDDCQYILSSKQASSGYNGHGYGFSMHKGNCNNPIHIYARP